MITVDLELNDIIEVYTAKAVVLMIARKQKLLNLERLILKFGPWTINMVGELINQNQYFQTLD